MIFVCKATTIKPTANKTFLLCIFISDLTHVNIVNVTFNFKSFDKSNCAVK